VDLRLQEVNHDDFDAGRQSFDNPAADEPGTAGDQKLHVFPESLIEAARMRAASIAGLAASFVASRLAGVSGCECRPTMVVPDRTARDGFVHGQLSLRGLARWRDSLGSIRARGRPIPWRLRFPDRTRPTG
jgi:hypothetical protein